MDKLKVYAKAQEPGPPLPPEAPMAMPEQDLRRFDRRAARRLPRDRRVRHDARRAVLRQRRAHRLVRGPDASGSGGGRAGRARGGDARAVRDQHRLDRQQHGVGPARALRAEAESGAIPDAPIRGRHRDPAADLQRGPRRGHRRRRRHPRGPGGGRRGRRVRSLRAQRHQPVDVWLAEQAVRRAGARRLRPRAAAVLPSPLGEPGPQGRQRRPTGSSDGAGPIPTCSCSTPTA